MSVNITQTLGPVLVKYVKNTKGSYFTVSMNGFIQSVPKTVDQLILDLLNLEIERKEIDMALEAMANRWLEDKHFQADTIHFGVAGSFMYVSDSFEADVAAGVS